MIATLLGFKNAFTVTCVTVFLVAATWLLLGILWEVIFGDKD